MRENIVSYVFGLVFGFGLLISGMSNPNKVLNFLKFWDQWDPSLAFVMIGGLAVTSLSYRYSKKQSQPWLAKKFNWPKRTEIDKPLLLGAVLFGMGWGLVGICPGPALTNLAQLRVDFIAFIVSMFVGIIIFQLTLTAFSKRQ